MYRGFPSGSDGKESACKVGDPGSIPGLGRSLGEGNGNPLYYSCLENSMNRGAWRATVHGVTKSWTLLTERLIHTHTHTHTRMYRSCYISLFAAYLWFSSFVLVDSSYHLVSFSPSSVPLLPSTFSVLLFSNKYPILQLYTY